MYGGNSDLWRMSLRRATQSLRIGAPLQHPKDME
jgi:hypothetical protein